MPPKTIFMKKRYFLVQTIHFVDNNIIWKDLRSMKYM